MTKRFKTGVLCCLGAILALCLSVAVLRLSEVRANAADPAQDVSYSTVAVHDPSIVLAYEDASGKTYPVGGEGRTKAYYVFGTNCAIAKSYDLINWTNVSSNVNNESSLYSLINGGNANVLVYTGNSQSTILGNSWAPDVVYNSTLEKWCMYLSVNGATYNSVIVLLTADSLNGVWTYAGEVVWSGMGYGNNQTALTDFQAVTGLDSVPARYSANRNGTLIYGVNAIDACVLYDGADLYMTYGSWFGGIFLLKLDPATGLRDTSVTYSTTISGDQEISSSAVYTVYSDEYFGVHIAGGHGQTGEGSYLQKIGDYYYLFLSYGGYAPNGGYNMRLFRSETITGYLNDDFSDTTKFTGYRDVGGTTALVQNSVTVSATDRTGLRMMSGYTWSWWNFSYVAQGHNSAFVDDDGNAYVVYHNKYMDGTYFHVMKTHRLLVNSDGWLTTSPFEALPTDTVATGLTASEIAGTYGVLFMTRNNGAYGKPVTEQEVTFFADGTVANIPGISKNSGTWAYDSATGAVSVTVDGYAYHGYFLRQKAEGTNVDVLAFTAVSSDSAAYSQYTYWGYRYPSNEISAQYTQSYYAFPEKANPDAYRATLLEAKGGLVNTVSIQPSSTELQLTVGDVGVNVAASANAAEIATWKCGASLLPVGNLSDKADVSVSFRISGYDSDWTTVFTGDQFSINLSTMLYGGANIFESAATAFGAGYSGSNAWSAFTDKSAATAKIVLLANGGLSVYKNGSLVLTYSGTTTFNESTATISDLTTAIRSAIANGTLVCAYGAGVTSVVVSGTVTTHERMELTLSDPDVNLIDTYQGDASGTRVDAVLNAETAGVAISFVLSGAASDWTSFAVQAGSYLITLPNLDAWGASGTLALTNKFPEAANFANGGTWDVFLNNECSVTITVDKLNGVCYYRNGVLVVTYPLTDPMNYNNAGASATVTVADFTDAVLALIAQEGFVFAASGMTGKDLIVTNSLTAEQAAGVYADYVALRQADSAAVNAFADAVEAVSAASGLPAKSSAIDAALTLYNGLSAHRKSLAETAYASLLAAQRAYKAEVASVTAFSDAVTAVGNATGMSGKFNAIGAALSVYDGMTDDAKSAAAEDYAALTEEISAYNGLAEKANAENKSAAEIAFAAVVSSVAAISALAAVGYVLKKFI